MEKQEHGNPKLNVLAFTDPYCSWCWTTEPMIISMMEKYRDQLHFTYVFGGLIKDMDEFYDATNDIRDASAVVPHWKMVSERSGQPIDERLWVDLAEIRHFSSWPANIACKAAFAQGEEIGFTFLRNMRETALTERRIISDQEVYDAVAKETEGLDVDLFRAAIADGSAEKAFLEDQVVTERWQAFGFPTMLFFRPEADVTTMTNLTRETAAYVGGHRSMETYDSVVQSLAPDITVHEARTEEELLAAYGPMTERELGQVVGRTKDEELKVLEALEAAGVVVRAPRVRGNIWSLAS